MEWLDSLIDEYRAKYTLGFIMGATTYGLTRAGSGRLGYDLPEKNRNSSIRDRGRQDAGVSVPIALVQDGYQIDQGMDIFSAAYDDPAVYAGVVTGFAVFRESDTLANSESIREYLDGR